MIREGEWWMAGRYDGEYDDLSPGHERPAMFSRRPAWAQREASTPTPFRSARRRCWTSRRPTGKPVVRYVDTSFALVQWTR